MHKIGVELFSKNWFNTIIRPPLVDEYMRSPVNFGINVLLVWLQGVKLPGVRIEKLLLKSVPKSVAFNFTLVILSQVNYH